MKIIFTFIAIIAIATGIFYLNHSKASISAFTIAPKTLSIDDVAGKNSASYTIAYNTSSGGGMIKTLSQIIVTFPIGYVITDGTLVPSTAINSTTQSKCFSTAGYICFNGFDSSFAVTSMTGSSSSRTITVNFAGISSSGGYTVAFTILQGIQNPPTAGVQAASDFIITDDFSGNGPTPASADVTIIAAPVPTPTPTPTPTPFTESIGGGITTIPSNVPGGPNCKVGDPKYDAKVCPPGAPSASVVGTVPGSPVYGAVLANNTGVFTHDLFVGTSDTDVTALQQFLVGKGYLTMPQGVAFGYFGNLTKAAVSSFQKAVGVTPTLGYFGAKTRAKVDAIAGNLPQGAIPTNTLPSNATLVAPSTGQAIEVLNPPINAVSY